MKTETHRYLSMNNFPVLIVFLNLFLVISSTVSYASGIISAVGGSGQLLVFLEPTPYFLLATIALDIFAAGAGNVGRSEEDYTTTKRFEVLNAFLAGVTLLSYYVILTFLQMNHYSIVQYQLPSNMLIGGRGSNWYIFDLVPWALLALLFSTLVAIMRQTIGLRIEISWRHKD